jgi:acyl carrier protein
MPLSSETERRIVEIVARRFKQPVAAFDRQARFREDLGADSLDLFELLWRLEDELGITVPDGLIAELRTLADVLDYLGQTDRRAA